MAVNRKEYQKEYNKEYYQKNKEKILNKVKNYSLENKEKIAEYKKEYNIKNKDTVIKDYKQKNKDTINKKAKEWRENNPEKYKKILEKNKIYAVENKDVIKKNKNEWEKSKRKTDKIFKIEKNIKALFRNSLKYNSIKKTDRFFKYTGIEINVYIEHFKQSEYWDRYCNKNDIHIDHIIPTSAYDYSSQEEIKKCWQPENLRLLPANENLEKLNKINIDLIKHHNIIHLLPKGLGI